MKFSKIIFAIITIITFLISSCRDIKSKDKTETIEEHGHEHDADGNHKSEEAIEQEEFTVEIDSLKKEKEIHTHNDGETDHDY